MLLLSCFLAAEQICKGASLQQDIALPSVDLCFILRLKDNAHWAFATFSAPRVSGHVLMATSTHNPGTMHGVRTSVVRNVLGPSGAGAATGVAAALAATGAPAGPLATAAVTSLLRRAASDAVLDGDASATCIVALGGIAATYCLRFRETDMHALEALQHVFAVAVHLLDEAIPELNEIIAEASTNLPEGWDADVDAEVSDLLAAVPKPQSGDAAPFTAAAVNILVNFLEASEDSEARQLALLLAGVLEHCSRLLPDSESGSAVYGACMAAMHAAPQILRVFFTAAEVESEPPAARHKWLEGATSVVRLSLIHISEPTRPY